MCRPFGGLGAAVALQRQAHWRGDGEPPLGAGAGMQSNPAADPMSLQRPIDLIELVHAWHRAFHRILSRLSTTRHQCTYSVADSPALFRTRAERHDFPGNLESKYFRRSRRRRVAALPLMQVCRVHSGSGHLNEHLTIARQGHFGFFDPKHLRSIETCQSDQSHGFSLEPLCSDPLGRSAYC